MQLSTSCTRAKSQTLISKPTLNVRRIDMIALLMLKAKHATQSSGAEDFQFKLLKKLCQTK